MLKTTRAVTGRVILLVSIFLVFFFTCGCSSSSDENCNPYTNHGTGLREAAVSDEEETSSDTDETAASLECGAVYVYVCGEVNAPGVYELPGDSRICRALEAAGGMTDAAADTYLNQAEKVSDGQKIYVPSKKEVQSGDAVQETDVQEEGSSAGNGKVNLNSASKEELMTLSGIGEVKAEAIIRYREENGGFTDIEELKKIEGIKDGVFNKVKDKIQV